MKSGAVARRFLITAGVLLALLIIGYLTAEQIVIGRIRADLKRAHGDDYAILRMNMGGRPAESPSLARMLMLAHEYRYSDLYLPQGSGGFTGKKNYLVILVSDNTSVQSYDWSVRLFRLDEETSPTRIDDIREQNREIYSYEAPTRKRRNGLWFKGEAFNNPKASFYAPTL